MESRKKPPAWKRALVKDFRRNPPPTERAIRDSLIKIGFHHQLIVCGYIADFAHIARKLVIELDGYSHETRQQYDAARTRAMQAKGWTVLRFSNELVKSDRAFVIKNIRSTLAALLTKQTSGANLPLA